jgi:tRNA (guanine-N7-)-methyltransferase
VGKGKLLKFSEMENFPNVFQPSFREVYGRDYKYKGGWKDYFGNTNPIILELGCGKGEYTTRMAALLPSVNYIGIDIKGARIWTGARHALEHKLDNVVFIRTRIEFITSLFSREEVMEIWLTFPDPQLRKRRNKKRLTGARFLNSYREFLVKDGVINLKTDNADLFEYTRKLVHLNRMEILQETDDLYAGNHISEVLKIKTFYEKQYLEEQMKIHYMAFRLPDRQIIEVGDED